MTYRGAVLAGAILAVAAADRACAVEAHFTCDDGTQLEASFVGGQTSPGSVALRFANGPTVHLPQAPSADGGRYADGSLELWVKGRGATLTRDGKATSCRAGANP